MNLRIVLLILSVIAIAIAANIVLWPLIGPWTLAVDIPLGLALGITIAELDMWRWRK